MMKRENKTKPDNHVSFVDKMKVTIKNEKQYKIFKSKQFIGLILLFIFSYLFIVSIVQISGFSTINSYTIGMLFGYYSYFVYFGFIWYGLSLLFDLNIKVDKFIAKKFKWKLNFSFMVYLVFIVGFALFTESIVQLVQFKKPFLGVDAFSLFFKSWWNDFTQSNNPVLPDIFNSGIIVSLFLSLISSWTGFPVSIIVGLLLMTYTIIYIIFGPIIKLFKDKIRYVKNNKQNIKKSEFEEYESRILDLSFEDENILSPQANIKASKKSNTNMKTISINIENSNEMFPIENPFSNSQKSEQDDFIKEKTCEIENIENKTNEIDFINDDVKDLKQNDEKSFEFELDIFSDENNIIDSTNFDPRKK